VLFREQKMFETLSDAGFPNGNDLLKTFIRENCFEERLCQEGENHLSQYGENDGENGDRFDVSVFYLMLKNLLDRLDPIARLLLKSGLEEELRITVGFPDEEKRKAGILFQLFEIGIDKVVDSF
jgi:hypothetical protein